MPAIHPSTPLAALHGIVLDTETTGLDARTARIIQVGAVRFEGGRVLADARLDLLVAPGIPIPPETTAIHGISNEEVASAPTFGEVADEVLAWLGSGIVVGHTIGYDLAILEREAALAGRRFEMPPSLDVRLLAQLANPGLAHYDLDRLAAWLGIGIEGRHTAIGDALATARMLAALVPMLRERNIRTLGEAMAAGRALAERQAGTTPAVALPPSAGDLLAAAPRVSRVEGFAYRHRVADVMSMPLVRLPAAAPVREAMRLLLERRVSSVLVDDAPSGAPGIFTERDLLRALDAHGAPGFELPLGHFARGPLQTIPADAFLYRAIGRMERLGIRHLAVTDHEQHLVGLVTTRNLLRDRATTAIVLGDAIDSAETVPGLAAAWAELPRVARSLIEDATDPVLAAAVVSSEIAALTRRAAELGERRMAESGHGPPPTPYAVLVLGSVGRGESLLAADQDNALVYATGEPDGDHDRWFAAMATHMADILDAVGVPYCKGGVMASKPAWRHSVAGWHGVIDGWMRRQQGEDILNVDIFFDGRAVHGDTTLGRQVLDHAFAAAGKARTLQLRLAEQARQWQSPIGWLGRIRTGEGGRIDLKRYGLFPILTAARALAIRHGVRGPGTGERLRELAARGIIPAADADALIDAHRTLLGLMLAQQLRDGEAGIPLSPRVALAQLSAADRAELKAALAKVAIAPLVAAST